jgi:hypothetical protein
MLVRNSRKTERGAGQFLVGLAVRAAPFALSAGSGLVFHMVSYGVRVDPERPFPPFAGIALAPLRAD